VIGAIFTALDGMVFASGWWGVVRGLEEQVGECAKQGDRQSNSDDAATS